MEWSNIECEAIVADYFEMLVLELRQEQYSKAAHRRALQQKLDNRSEGSIEYKRQNISAILLELGYPYINGYKPAYNYQQLLKETVESYLPISNIVDVAAGLIDSSREPTVVEWKSVLENPPEYQKELLVDAVREFKPEKFNFSAMEAKNRSLGEQGEKFIIEFEKHRLATANRSDLVGEIEWTSKVKGDGAGYDIRSFNPDSEEELFIEVKTTNLGKYMPFYISNNEVEYSKINKSKYALYRVFQFRASPKLFMLNGDITEHIHLQALEYKAYF